MPNPIRNLLYFFIIAIFCWSCRQDISSAENQAPPPNVIFIFADDLGYGDVSSYNPNSKINTPHIDRLVKEGMKFTDAHTSSAVCTPSRYSLLTGRYCWRSELKNGVQGGYGLPLIKSDQLTMGELFQQHAYQTAVIGKWHLGMQWTLKPGMEEQEEEAIEHLAPIKYGPNDQGFDYFFGTSGCTSDDSPFAFIENKQLLADTLIRIEGLNVVGDGDFVKDVWAAKDWKHEAADTIFTNKAIQFMEQQVGQNMPFFVYLPLSLPHIPWLPPAFMKGKTDAGPRGDQVALTDYCVQKIQQGVKRLGIEDNTIIVFSSDNGPRQGINGHQSAGKLRGYKGKIFEGGHRVPLVVKWPGKVAPGSVSDQTVCLADFMATFAGILHADLPDKAAEDSYNLLPILLQEENATPLRTSTVHHSGAGAFAIRKGDWKIIFGQIEYDEEPEDPENWKKRGYLFNLAKDPGETNNVYQQHPDIVAEMNQLLEEYRILTDGI